MLRSAGVFSFLSRFCLFGMVSGLFNTIVDNLWLLWETLLSPLFCGYMGTLGVFVFKGLLGWGGCFTSALYDHFNFFFIQMVNDNIYPSIAGSGTPLRFISWNIRGMGNPVKRSKVFAHLKRLNSDLVFLQETHLRVKDQCRLHCPWVGQVFHSNFNSKARGGRHFN